MILGGYQIIDLTGMELVGSPADGTTGELKIEEVGRKYNKIVLVNNILGAVKYSKKPVAVRGLDLVITEEDDPEILNPMHEQHIVLDWAFGYMSENPESDNGVAIYLHLNPCILYFYVKNGEVVFGGLSKFLADNSLSQQQADERYVNVTGDFMTGDLDMRDNNILNVNDLTSVNTITMDPAHGQITNVADPKNDRDAVNKQWAEKTYVNVTGDTMEGDLSLGGYRIHDLDDPVQDRDAVNKQFANREYVNVDGDTMYGNLSMNQNSITDLKDPINNSDAVNLKTLKSEIEKLGNVLNFKGSKDTFAELPTENNKVGDVWYVKERDTGYVWVVDATDPTGRWEEFGPEGGVDLSDYIRKDELVQDIRDNTIRDKVAVNKVVSLLAIRKSAVLFSDLITDMGNVRLFACGDWTGSHIRLFKILAGQMSQFPGTIWSKGESQNFELYAFDFIYGDFYEFPEYAHIVNGFDSSGNYHQFKIKIESSTSKDPKYYVNATITLLTDDWNVTQDNDYVYMS